MTDGLLDAAVDLTERVLERGIVLVLQLRRTPTGRRMTIGIGLLDSTDALLFSAAANRVLRRRAHHEADRRRSASTPPQPDWLQDDQEDL